MIERYSLPEMAAIWSATHKTDKWLAVELLVCEGWAREGVIRQEAIEKIRRARYNAQRMAEIEQETHHDTQRGWHTTLHLSRGTHYDSSTSSSTI